MRFFGHYVLIEKTVTYTYNPDYEQFSYGFFSVYIRSPFIKCWSTTWKDNNLLIYLIFNIYVPKRSGRY